MFKEYRFRLIITVDENKESSPAGIQSEIPGLGDPSTGQMMNMYTGILLLGFIQHGGRLAITGVIKEEPLKIGQGLA